MNSSAKKIVGISSVILLSFATGLITSPYIFTQNNEKITKEIRKNFNYQYINPLLECEESNISQDKNLTSLKKEIEFIIDQGINSHKISFGSIYYRDLNNGPWISINANEYFSPASLIKVPVMIAYFKESEIDPTILQKKLLTLNLLTIPNKISPLLKS